jgi:hypothetical protein
MNRTVFISLLVLTGLSSASCDQVSALKDKAMGSGGSQVTGVKLKAMNSAQSQLDAIYGQGTYTVTNVEMVPLSQNQFDGNLTVVKNGAVLFLPAKISSDGSAAVVHLDMSSLKGGKVEADYVADKPLIQSLETINSYDIIKPEYRRLFPKSLVKDLPKLSQRAEVGYPVEIRGNFVYGSTCKAHACSMDEAVWVVNRSTGRMTAIVMQTQVFDSSAYSGKRRFTIYGARANTLPAPLVQWANEYQMNTGEITERP